MAIEPVRPITIWSPIPGCQQCSGCPDRRFDAARRLQPIAPRNSADVPVMLDGCRRHVVDREPCAAVSVAGGLCCSCRDDQDRHRAGSRTWTGHGFDVGLTQLSYFESHVSIEASFLTLAGSTDCSNLGRGCHRRCGNRRFGGWLLAACVVGSAAWIADRAVFAGSCPGGTRPPRAAKFKGLRWARPPSAITSRSGPRAAPLAAC